jgi:hypothetical protein
MNREPIELAWIEHCEQQLAHCPNEKAIWETAIRESRERLEAYRLERDKQHPVRNPND